MTITIPGQLDYGLCSLWSWECPASLKGAIFEKNPRGPAKRGGLLRFSRAWHYSFTAYAVRKKEPIAIFFAFITLAKLCSFSRLTRIGIPSYPAQNAIWNP
ncbi:MAG TPA: hypothetical protein VMW23_06615 [Sedimentisphaerales bacterium]|nr:hypothetical protein [Sedimentisphaerales bacterium]